MYKRPSVFIIAALILGLAGCSIFNSASKNVPDSSLSENSKAEATQNDNLPTDTGGNTEGTAVSSEQNTGFPSVTGETKTITVYFGNENADKVAPEKRVVKLNKGDSLEETVFNELLKGPAQEGHHPVVPGGTRLLSVKTEGGICELNLSKEFVTNNHSGTAGESMTLNSIVNSLTEIDGITKVQFLIEGKKEPVYLHAVFDRPFSRNQSIIEN